jgi:alanine racemase
MAFAVGSPVRPVLNTPEQVARWKAAGGGACDVMIDTGMNRLGLDPSVLPGLIDGLRIETLMSHLACADEDHPLNAEQLAAFHDVAGRVPANRYSLANSAGILLGTDYAFDLTRPGIGLYGGIARAEATGSISQVVRPHAQILQRRHVRSGESIGYGATFVAAEAREAAILNIGYADGYLRGFSGTGAALLDGRRLPLLGRVSMDLIAIDVSDAPGLAEGDWLELEYDLPTASMQSDLSQYELLTGMGRRYARIWR